MPRLYTILITIIIWQISNVEGAQNVEISKKIPCEKPLIVQLEIMERYTAVHKACAALPKEIREVECLKGFIPHAISQDHESRLDRRTYGLPTDRVRMRNLIRGCRALLRIQELRAFQLQLDETERKRVDALYDYWLDHDLKTQFNKEVLTEDTLGMFIDCEYPMIATARLSGMMLDYRNYWIRASVAFALIYRRNSKSNPIITFTKQASNVWIFL